MTAFASGRLKGFIRLAVSLGLLGWLLWSLDLAAFVRDAARLPWYVIVGASSLLFATYLAGAFRWWLLLRALTHAEGLRQIFPGYYVGLVCNHLLPTGIGGDAVRTALFYRRGYALAPLLASAIMDRFAGLWWVLVMTSVGLFMVTGILPGETQFWFGGVGLAGAAVATALMMSSAIHQWVAKLAPPGPVAGKLLEVWRQWLRYAGQRLLLVQVLLLTALTVTGSIVVYAWLGNVLGLNLPVSFYVIAVPVSMLAANLPLSVGGLGVREGALVALLSHQGVLLQDALTLSVLALAVMWLSLLPGVAVTIQGGLRQRPAGKLESSSYGK